MHYAQQLFVSVSFCIYWCSIIMYSSMREIRLSFVSKSNLKGGDLYLAISYKITAYKTHTYILYTELFLFIIIKPEVSTLKRFPSLMSSPILQIAKFHKQKVFIQFSSAFWCKVYISLNAYIKEIIYRNKPKL